MSTLALSMALYWVASAASAGAADIPCGSGEIPVSASSAECFTDLTEFPSRVHQHRAGMSHSHSMCRVSDMVVESPSKEECVFTESDLLGFESKLEELVEAHAFEVLKAKCLANAASLVNSKRVIAADARLVSCAQTSGSVFRGALRIEREAGYEGCCRR